jgi:adenine-specific DNA-methyltransferase
MPRQKLELTWIGKDDRPRLEPRILIEDPVLSHHAAANVTGHDIYDNRLKALEQEYAGKVKCIFIDPPYNTGSAFEHYDDGVEHSLWLSMMRDRLEMLRRLLAPGGSLWITLDDNEAHYLKVLCDEVFGRSDFVANVIWQKKYAKQNDAQWFSTSHDHLFVFARDKEMFNPKGVARSAGSLRGYSNPDDDPRGPWQSVVYTCAKTRAERPNLYYAVTRPADNTQIYPSESRVWGYDEAAHQEHVLENRLWWGADGSADKPRLKVFLAEVGQRVVPDTLWLRDDVGDNQDAKREARALNPTNTFATPKPERLLQRILEIATTDGDLVLDSFAGSGTTGAVAHKMGRRWIMIELGEHAHTHVIPRLKKVIDGEDPGGITESVNWKGGGGFRYFRLAPSLLEKDRWGNWVISKQYNAAMLAEAMCKHEGFTYAPSADVYWQQGRSSERDYIYVTTQTVTAEQLSVLSEEVGADRTLLVCCSAWRGAGDRWRNLTLKKIPAAVRDRCEFGRDDYSLRVAALPVLEPQEATDLAAEERPAPRRAGRRRAPAANNETIDIFAGAEPTATIEE